MTYFPDLSNITNGIISFFICLLVALFFMPVDNGMGMGWSPPLGIQFVMWIANKIKILFGELFK